MDDQERKPNPIEEVINIEPPPRSIAGVLLYHSLLALTSRVANLSYSGQENIPASPYILAPNHQTYADAIWVLSGLPRDDFQQTCCMVGKDMQTEHGAFGRMACQVARPIYVDRRGNPVRSLMEARHALRAGCNILLHPEGTRTHDGLIAPLHSGASFLAMREKVPLVPVYIGGGFDFFSRHDKKPLKKNPVTGEKTDLHIHFGQPLLPSSFSPRDYDGMTQALKEWYEDQEALFFLKYPYARAALTYHNEMRKKEREEEKKLLHKPADPDRSEDLNKDEARSEGLDKGETRED